MVQTHHHFVNGKPAEGTSGRFGDVFNPSTGEMAARVSLASKGEMEAAIAASQTAFEEWGQTSVVRRARVLFKFLELATAEKDKLAEMLSNEHGKTFEDAKGDVQRGLEVVEFA